MGVPPEMFGHLLHFGARAVESIVGEVKSERESKQLEAQRAVWQQKAQELRKRAQDLELSDDPLDLQTVEAKREFVGRVAGSVAAMSKLGNLLAMPSAAVDLQCPVCGGMARFGPGPMVCSKEGHQLDIGACGRCQAVITYTGVGTLPCPLCGTALSRPAQRSLSEFLALAETGAVQPPPHEAVLHPIPRDAVPVAIDAAITRIKILELRYSASLKGMDH